MITERLQKEKISVEFMPTKQALDPLKFA